MHGPHPTDGIPVRPALGPPDADGPALSRHFILKEQNIITGGRIHASPTHSMDACWRQHRSAPNPPLVLVIRSCRGPTSVLLLDTEELVLLVDKEEGKS